MARVYVGTYGKYNSGSIAGGWLDLADYKTYSDFLAACRKLHKGEHDPEFMIQDCEDFPDGLGCMEWLSEQDFNDVKKAMQDEEEQEAAANLTIIEYNDKSFAVIGDTKPIKDELKRLGGRFNGKLSCGSGWIFSNKARDAVNAFIGGGCYTQQRQPQNDEWKVFTDTLKEFLETQCKCPSDVTYYGKGNVGAIKIDGHYYLIKKPSIENKFCFHDEGPQYDFYLRLSSDDALLRKHFLQKNEAVFTNLIERINKGDAVRIESSDYLNRLNLYVGGYYYESMKGRLVSEEEKQLIIKGLEFGLEQFKKRLTAYLKRYGTSKLHTWTYWADA